MAAAANSKPTVVEALAAVMGEVQGLAKGDRNTQQNYNFRGVDATVNAVGPAFRKHNIVAVPISALCESEHYVTAKGTPMRGVTLTVGFRFYGPAGDFIDAQVCGEASDSGDKAVPKAHSVAFRTLLLQALCIPTNEPDPDSESHDRAAKSAPAVDAKPTPVDTGPGEAAGAESNGAVAELTAKLLAAADQLGALDATTAAIAANAAKGDPAGHVAWLERCLKTAEENLAEPKFVAPKAKAEAKA
jgi:hypothetical protein